MRIRKPGTTVRVGKPALRGLAKLRQGLSNQAAAKARAAGPNPGFSKAGFSKGGMVKKANCGASMKPTQGKKKKK